MGQLARQIAVVGNQQYAHAVFVEPSYWVDPFGAGVSDQVHNGFVCVGVFERSDVSFGLVHQDVDVFLAVDHFAVEADFIAGVDLGAQFRYDLAVDAYHSGRNQVVGLATRADARVCDKAVETDGSGLLGCFEARIVRGVVFLEAFVIPVCALAAFPTVAISAAAVAVGAPAVVFAERAFPVTGVAAVSARGVVLAVSVFTERMLSVAGIFVIGTVPAAVVFAAVIAVGPLFIPITAVRLVVFTERFAGTAVVISSRMIVVPAETVVVTSRTVVFAAVVACEVGVERTARSFIFLAGRVAQTRAALFALVFHKLGRRVVIVAAARVIATGEAFAGGFLTVAFAGETSLFLFRIECFHRCFLSWLYGLKSEIIAAEVLLID